MIAEQIWEWSIQLWLFNSSPLHLFLSTHTHTHTLSALLSSSFQSGEDALFGISIPLYLQLEVYLPFGGGARGREGQTRQVSWRVFYSDMEVRLEEKHKQKGTISQLYCTVHVLSSLLFPDYTSFLLPWIIISLLFFPLRPVCHIRSSRNTPVKPCAHQLGSHVLRLHCKQGRSGKERKKKKTQDSEAVNVRYTEIKI